MGWSPQLFAVCFVFYGVAHWGASLYTGALVDRFSAVRILTYFPLPMLLGLLTAILHSGNWVAYAGGYSDMLAQRSGKVAGNKPVKKDAIKKEAGKKDSTKKNADENGGEGSSSQSAKRSNRLSYKQTYRLEKLPGEMEALEHEIDKLETQMADSDFYVRDPEGFQACAKKLDLAKSNFEQSEQEWLELEILREELGA